MRPLIITIFAVCTISGYAQERGANPVESSLSESAGATRALIVGISEYANIADLRFADRDANEFYGFLLTKAGGAVPKENIILLRNKEATQGAILDALYWLNMETRKSDKAIIYFSGHGDVETQTLWQLGYLLTYNTPLNNYPNNAIELEYLNKVITSISVGREAQVIVILDACRSGKLAGADNLGPTLTAEQAAIQKANEVRILSCQSDQVSMESERWGGGRGLFSYHFINGLKGLANEPEDDDNEVLFYEMKEYLRREIRKSLREANISNPQSATFVGQNDNFKLAVIDAETYSSVSRELMAGNNAELAVTEDTRVAGRGINGSPSAHVSGMWEVFSKVVERRIGEGVDYTLHTNYQPENIVAALLSDFNSSGVQDSLREEEKNGLLEFIQLASESENAGKQKLTFYRDVAVHLHDLVQKVINLYLAGDSGELSRRYYKSQVQVYSLYPKLLNAASYLLPEDHPLRSQLKVKYHYFHGVGIRMQGLLSGGIEPALEEALKQQHLALQLDKNAAYIHNELGLIYLLKVEYEAARKHFEIAAKNAPTWVLPRANLCAVYTFTGQLGKAKESAQRAIELDESYFGTYINIGLVYEKEKDYLNAETMYRKARALNDEHYLPFERRGYVQLETTRYDEAERQFFEADMRKKGEIILMDPVVMGLSLKMDEPVIFTYPSLSGPGVLHKKPQTAQEYFMTGKYFFENDQFEKAEPFLNTAMKMTPGHPEVYYYLGIILYQQNRYEEAEICFDRLIKLQPEVKHLPFYLADVYRDWQRFDEEEQVLEGLIDNNIEKAEERLQAMERLAGLLDRQGRFGEKEFLLWRLYDEAPRRALHPLLGFYRKMVEKNPANAYWTFKLGDYLFKHAVELYDGHSAEDIMENAVHHYEKTIEQDSTFSARAFIHNKAGYYYLNRGLKESRELSEQSSRWEELHGKAIGHFQQAITLHPEEPAPQYGIAASYLHLFDYANAVKILEKLKDNNLLNYENRILLADLLIQSGRFEEASELIEKALYMQPEPIGGLHEVAGKLHLLQGHWETAAKHYLMEEAMQMEGKMQNHQYTLARLYQRQGQTAKALYWLNRAIDGGFKHRFVVAYDREWDSIRDTEDFLILTNRLNN